MFLIPTCNYCADLQTKQFEKSKNIVRIKTGMCKYKWYCSTSDDIDLEKTFAGFDMVEELTKAVFKDMGVNLNGRVTGSKLRFD